MRSLKHFAVHWGPVFVLAAFVYFFSDQPDLKSGLEAKWDLILRKMAHMAEYGLLVFLLARAWVKGHGHSLRRALILALVMAVLYAVGDELHQGFVKGRFGSPWDVAIDTIGAGLGVATFLLFSKRKRRRN